jgi:hypothetical protein
MRFFPIGSGSSGLQQNHRNLVARYQRLRLTRLRLNNELVRRLSRDVLYEGARQLGILHGKTIVFDNEDQSSVLMDYCIYDVFRAGRNAIDQYLCECPPEPGSDEGICLQAMQRATFALIVVECIEPGVGCYVRNLFTEETRLLIDMGLSQTGMPGGILATRLLDFGDYIATGGAGLLLGVLEHASWEELRQMLPPGWDDPDFDPAPLIRECLRQGASEHIAYEQVSVPRKTRSQRPLPRLEDLGQRKRELTAHQAGLESANRRCRCGSGKMYKNCCGKVRS